MVLSGVRHNIPFLRALCDHPAFIGGQLSTNFIPEHYAEGFKGIDAYKQKHAKHTHTHTLSSGASYLLEDWEGLVAVGVAAHTAALWAKASISDKGRWARIEI